MQEWVIVRFPRSRSVFVDDQRVGPTNRLLSVPPGRHTVDLGSPVDYTPAGCTVEVSGTASDDPMEIVFHRLQLAGLDR